MKIATVAESNPFKQDMLSHSECYILDNGGDNKIFVWKGIVASVNSPLQCLVFGCTMFCVFADARFTHSIKFAS